MMWGSNMTFAPIAAWVCGLIIGLALLQILLRPLRLSKRSIAFDAFLILFCFIGLFPGINEIVGIVAALGVVVAILGLAVFASPLILIAAVIAYFVLRKRPSSEDTKTPYQFSLAEGLAMVLAGSSLPLVMSAMGMGNPAGNLLYMMGLIPLLYLRAWHRLSAHNVPYSTLRLAFVAVYPYLIFGVLYVSLYVAILMVPEARQRMDQNLASFFNAPAAVLFTAIAVFATFVTLNLPSVSNNEDARTLA